ncbi:MAG TPA: alkaline phosphatase family protein [Candidatus Limnocylindrales bacterium]|jgi:phospholipase C|nr:alkaline phosphatase family protein [Candidatus Limnocylindrales bacterium]
MKKQQSRLKRASTHRQTRSGFPRRRFLRQVTVGTLGFGGVVSSSLAMPRDKRLPKPNQSGIEHVVLVMMENRSFDHFLGWLPGAEARQEGLSYADASGVSHSTYPLAPDYQGCGHPDPDHSYTGGRVEFDNGACDGWLRAGTNDIYAIGYYVANDLAFFAPAAQQWTTCDHYFAPIMAPTYPNRIYQHAAQTDRLDDSLLPLSSLPTIWDRLLDHSLSARYYFNDIPFLAFWGAKYVPISRSIDQFFLDCSAGTLPHVSFVDPPFFGEEEGLSSDDHPHADIRRGELFLNTIYEAVTSSPAWPNTVLIINYDEWGGFFEHVPPSVAPIPSGDAALGSDGRRGFRVPALIISPWSPRGKVAPGLYDHTSVLKMLEWRWNLRPLTVRDATANNLAEVLDFAHPNLEAPTFNVPAGPFGSICPLETRAVGRSQILLERAASFGFPMAQTQ